MATEAQVQANRLNAQKSTGPRTAEGKAAVSQNAVRHGFSGRLDVIRGEEQAEFDLHREAMLEELAPAGPMETMLAERIVGLSWRLKRAERMQDEAFEALLTPDTSNLAVRITQSLRSKRPQEEKEAEDELAFGRAVVKDFSHSRVLDRLLMYERRIEHSLYRTMAELQRLRVLREVDGSPQQAVRSGPGTVGAGFKPARPTSEETPHGVTTNEVGRGRPTPEEPPGVTANAPATPDESCKTKPIGGGTNSEQVPRGTGVTKIEALPAAAKTKPMGGLGIDLDALEVADPGEGGGEARSQGCLAGDNSGGQGHNEREKGCLGHGGSVN